MDSDPFLIIKQKKGRTSSNKKDLIKLTATTLRKNERIRQKLRASQINKDQLKITQKTLLKDDKIQQKQRTSQINQDQLKLAVKVLLKNEEIMKIENEELMQEDDSLSNKVMNQALVSNYIRHKILTFGRQKRKKAFVNTDRFHILPHEAEQEQAKGQKSDQFWKISLRIRLMTMSSLKRESVDQKGLFEYVASLEQQVRLANSKSTNLFEDRALNIYHSSDGQPTLTQDKYYQYIGNVRSQRKTKNQDKEEQIIYE